MKPIIGINCDYEEEGQQPYSFVYRNYVEAIIAAGGIPLLLPIIKDGDDVRNSLKRIDGLILTGGNDVPPQRYGKECHQKTLCVHPDKDLSDNLLVNIAFQMKKQILAICYGAQLVNVVFGGSLIQDIPSHGISCIVHKDLQNKHYTHPVTVEKRSCLHKIVGTEHLETNSAHHQAIDKLGNGLIATAHTEDGIVEAIELEGYPFFVGVQWHPERMTADPCHASLFSALVIASK
ncbi:MAG: gamma-glutamyl-gamma-aminobutyrate hydrolase family protein [Candidatus Brocadia sp.]|nr:MAG: gamma-glutamyl-gamma-aminobutyrate hydrolase family protein [Candidatus Brocadia sp.]